MLLNDLFTPYYYIITHGDHKHIINKCLASVTKSAFGNHKYKT